MRFTVLALFISGFLMGQVNGPAAQQPARRQVEWVKLGYYKELTPERWKSRVDQMLQRDAQTPPKSEAVMFVGSATIAGWDVKHYFPEYETINRGIGASLISEATYYADRMVIPFKPSGFSLP